MQTAKKSNNLDALTGLRFIAAAAVVIKHSSLAYTVPKLSLPLGNFAVSFFFVLSGFILTFAYQKRLSTWADCKRFWMMRIARIWPVAMVCMILAIFLIRNPAEFHTTRDGFIRLVTSITSTQSWIPHREFGYGINPVSWSISVEFFFYAMFPLLFWGGATRFLRRIPWVTAASLGLVALVIFGETTSRLPEGLDCHIFVQCNPLVRLLEFTLGIFIGFKYVNWRERRGEAPRWDFSSSMFAELVALSLIPVAWYVHQTHWYLEWIPTALGQSKTLTSWLHFCAFAPVFAINVWVFAISSGPVHRLLSSRPLVYLGEISFSLYMIHYVVLIFLNNEFRNSILYDDIWLALSTIFLLSIAGSILLYHCVEMPGKWFITKLYDREFGDAVPGLVDRVRQSLQSPSVVAPLVIVFAATSYLVSIPRDYSAVPVPRTLAELLDQPDVIPTNAKFADSATLHGFWYEETDEAILLNTIWTSEPSHLLPTLAICDQNKSQVYRLPETCQDETCLRGDGAPFVRQTRIDRQLLTNAGALTLSLGTRFKGPAKLTSNFDQWPANRLALPLPEQFESDEVLEILNQGDQYWQQTVAFEDHSELLGYKWIESNDNLKLRLLWSRQGQNEKELFAHVCQEDGQMLRQSTTAFKAGKFSPSRFLQMRELEFSAEELKDASIVGLGYYRADLGWGEVKGGYTAFADRRLEIPLPEKWGQQSARQFVKEHALPEGPITFGDVAQLLAMETQLQDDGWHVRSVWRKTGNLQHNRFAHICDATGKIIGHATQSTRSRELSSILPLIMDELVIPVDRLTQARSIGFGFYSKKLGTLLIDHGQRSMNNRRLDVLVPADIQASLAQENERPRTNTAKVKQATFTESLR